jgi:transcription elongation factor Elf1
MTCPKCSGLLVAEQALELYGSMAGWKCVNCGWMSQITRPRSGPSNHCRHTSPRLPKG